jgi:ABC-2 type transport system ATP-binding protein
LATSGRCWTRARCSPAAAGVITCCGSPASGNRITLRTTAPAEAMTALANAGAEVSLTGSGALKVSNLSSERTVATLTSHAIPFSEVSAHRATLEQAYMELTSRSVEYRAEATS